MSAAVSHREVSPIQYKSACLYSDVFTSVVNETTFQIQGHTHVSSACKVLVTNMRCSVPLCFLLHQHVGVRHQTSDAPAAGS